MRLYWPVRIEDGAFITQGFGEHPEIYAQFGHKGHNGIDFYSKHGAKCYASHNGFLKRGLFEANGYGNYVMILNPEGITYYAHFDRFEGSNRYVEAGEVIGYIDSTGFSTGSHLHFTYKPTGEPSNNGYGGAVDPAPFMFNPLEKPNMSNAIFVHRAGTNEYGFYLPATNGEAIKDKAINFGQTIIKPDGTIDFAKAKDINGL